jgi:hypothetical protein
VTSVTASYFARTVLRQRGFGRIETLRGFSHLKIDYHSTDVQVSRQVAEWYTSSGQDVFILNLASSFRFCEDGLPSWTPNLSRLGNHWCIGVIWPRFRTGMDKESISRPFASFLSGELHVRGIRVDQITYVVSYSGKPHNSQAERFGNILNWEEACLELSKSVFGGTGISVPKAHWMTIISGICDNHLQPNRGDYNTLKCFLRLVSARQCLPPELEARYQDLTTQIRRLCQFRDSGDFSVHRTGELALGQLAHSLEIRFVSSITGSHHSLYAKSPNLHQNTNSLATLIPTA